MIGAMKQALEAEINLVLTDPDSTLSFGAQRALKYVSNQIQAIEQAEKQEPVAWVRDLTSPQPHCVTSLKYLSIADTDAGVKYIPVYTAPPKREWVGLTEDEYDMCDEHETWRSMYNVAAKLKEKNT